MKRIVWFLFIFLAGCQSPPAPAAPTVPPPPPLAEVATQPAAAVPTAAPAPTAADQQPTPTLSSPPPQPSPSPTPPPADQPTATAVPTYSLTITDPPPASVIVVDTTVTFRGTIDPIPTDPPMLQLLAADASLPAFLGSVDLDNDTGTWSLTVTDISPRRTGPAALIATAGQSQTEIPVDLVIPREVTATYLILNEPNHGDVAVVGHAVLLSGESRNPIDEQISLLIRRCGVDGPPISRISINVGDGPWRAQMLIPEGTPPGKVCVETGSGGLTEADPSIRWFGSASLELIEPDIPEAALVRVGERASLAFRPGQTTALYGLAVNAPDEQVTLRLLVDDDIIVAESTAPVDDWGYWEGSLAVPADVDPAAVTLNAFYVAEDGSIVGE